MINFEWYRSFIAVYRVGTVTGAAEARYLTQPAISQHIVALESAVGQALFERTPRKMIPTEHGKALYSRVAGSLDGLEKVSLGLRESDIAQKAFIRLGTPLEYFHEVGLQKVGDSAFHLHVEVGEADKMLDALSRGKLDVVIATQPDHNNSIDYVKMDQEDFCLVAPRKMILPKAVRKQRKDIERFLLEQSWLSYSVELPIIRRFWQIVFKHRPSIEPQLIAPSLLLLRKAVELGQGISVLPRYLVAEELETGTLRILWQPKESVVNDLWLATRKVDRNNIMLARFIALLK